MSCEIGTATNYLNLLEKLNAFLVKGHSLPPVYTGTGTGTITLLMGTAASVLETITVTFSSATAFAVTGSVSGAMGTGTVGAAFSHARCTFTIVAGGTAWAAADTISAVMTPPWVALADVVGYLGSSTYLDTYSADKAFDASLATCWISEDGVTSGQVEVDFGLAHTIVEYAVQARNDLSQPTSCPNAWTLEYWNGASWSVADTKTAQTGWAQGQKRVFALSPSRSAAKWRINISANNGFASYVDLGELELRESVGGTDIAQIGCVWRAPGNANLDQIYVGARPFQDVATDYFNWRLGVFIGYTAGAAWASQPGARTTCLLPLWDDAIPYWFVADGKHVAIVVRISGVYESAYLGFDDSYASPGQSPYPVFIGGSLRFASEPAVSSLTWRWSNTGAEHSAFWQSFNGTAAAFEMRKNDGTWLTFDGAAYPLADRGIGSVWPYIVGGTLAGMQYLLPNLDGTFPLFPIVPNDPNGSYGELTGVAATTGYSQASENTITVDRIPWLVIQNMFRATRNTFAAFRLA